MRAKTGGFVCIILALNLITMDRSIASEGFDDLVNLLKANDDAVRTYVRRSHIAYDFTVDEIIFLRDMGVSPKIISEAINHGRRLRALEANTPIVVVAPPADETNMSLFFDALEPYGDWSEIEGTWVWRPEVAQENPNWRPYCDAGNWVYTDAGWAWHSEYSWGWAPFHYGRWKNDPRFGWLWTPDNVWAPAWVSWRTGRSHYGWAPLPPSAHFTEKVGFQNVTAEDNFGLRERDYSFVPADKIYEPVLTTQVIPTANITNVYNTTTIVQNNITFNDNRVINRGPSIEHVREATGKEIREIHIADRDVKIGEPIQGNALTQSTFSVYRPKIKDTAPVTTDLVQARRKALEQKAETGQTLKAEKIAAASARATDKRESEAAAKQQILDGRKLTRDLKKEEAATEALERKMAQEQALKNEANLRVARQQEEAKKQTALAAEEQVAAAAKAKAEAAQRDALEAKRAQNMAEIQARTLARQQEEAKKQAELNAEAQAKATAKAKAEASQREALEAKRAQDAADIQAKALARQQEEAKKQAELAAESQAKVAAKLKAEAAQREALEAKRVESAAEIRAKALARQQEEAKKRAELAAEEQARAAAKEKTKEVADAKREERKEAIAERTPEIGLLAEKPATAKPEVTAVLISKQYNPDRTYNLIASGELALQIESLTKKGAKVRVRGKVTADNINVESIEEIKKGK